jgi:hypothetical protein
MGYIREHRSEKILENALLKWLLDGHIPTAGELQEAFNEEVEQHGDLTRSGLRQVDLPQRWEDSSASDHNSVVTALKDDIDVILRALMDCTDLGITLVDEWNSRSKSLDVRLEKLKSRIESLLLLKSDAAGFVSFVEDGFFSLEYVSSDTTANVDTNTGEVSLAVDRSEGEGKYKGTQIDLSSASVSWSLIESNNVRFSTRPAGSSINNIVSDKKTRWGLEANAIQPNKFKTANRESKPVLGELKVKLVNKEEISRIVLIASDATAGSSSVISAQYSVDGYTWENVVSESPIQSGTGNFIWRFPKTELQWIKFVISKSSPDQSLTIGTVYDFGFERIKLYSEVFTVTTDGVDLVSELRTPTLGGQDVVFGRASLEVCDEVPDKTSIVYYIRAYDGLAYTNWVPISPLSKVVDGIPAIIDFSAPTGLDSTSLTTVFDSSIDSDALNILRVDGASSLSYRFGGPDDAVTNFYVPLSDNYITDIALLRNIGYAAAKYPTVTSGDVKVGDIECGWGLDGDSIYYCAFKVKNPNGITIDFGHTQALIDQKSISGTVNISPGWHTFRTDRANWGPLTGTVPTSDVELKSIDPLYPYNHKYLIEGYTYPTAWTGEKIYLGVDEYGQYNCSRIGRHNFVSSELDLSIYSMDVISGPKTIFLLKFDSSRPNHENERVKLFYTRRFDSYEGIQFKAVLKTEDFEKTPILSYYRIRVK